MANAYYASQDALAPPFDALASSVASTSDACGWDSRDHVTPFGLEGPEPFPYPFVNPADICDVVPFIPHSASQLGDEDDADQEYEDDDDEAPEPVAVEELDSDNYLEQVDAWLASLSAEPVAIVEEPVNEPEVVVKPSALRPSKRQRSPDAEIYPARPKKSKCMHSHSPSPAPSRASRSPTPTLPEPIVVVPTALLHDARLRRQPDPRGRHLAEPLQSRTPEGGVDH